MRCAVLRCAVPRRAVPVPVRLLVLCITVTFRLSVRVSFPLCCGRYVCFSKPLTFHNGSMFFRSSCMVRALFQTSSPTNFTYQEGLEVSKCAWNSYEKQKNMKPLWRVKGFEKQTSWKECSRLRFLLRTRAKIVKPTCTSVCSCKLWSWECVRHRHTTPTHTPHTHNTTQHRDGERDKTLSRFYGW